MNAVIGCLSKEGSTVAEECVRPFVHSVLCAEAAGVPWKSQYVGRRHESPRAYFTETRSDESGPTFSGGVAARMKLAGLEARPIREQIHLTAFMDWMSDEFPDWNTDGIPASTRIPVTVGPEIREREAWADALNGISAEYPTVPDGMFVAVSPSSEAIQIAEKVAAVNNSIDLAFGPPRDKIVLIAQGRSTLHVLSMYMMDFSMLQMEGRACVGGPTTRTTRALRPLPLALRGSVPPSSCTRRFSGPSGGLTAASKDRIPVDPAGAANELLKAVPQAAGSCYKTCLCHRTRRGGSRRGGSRRGGSFVSHTTP